MSLVYGNLNSKHLPWLQARLHEWPAFPVDITTYQYPRGDGGYTSKPRMSTTQWVFTLEITARNWAQAQEYAGIVNRYLYADWGSLHSFIPEGQTPWVWTALCSSGPSWQRDKTLWFGSQGVCRMSADVTFTTLDPFGYSPVEELPINSLDGTYQDFPCAEYTLAYYPRLRIQMGAVGQEGIRVNGMQIVTSGLPAGGTFHLDFGKYDFVYAPRMSSRKISIAERISNFTRIRSNDSGGVSLSVSSASDTKILRAYLIRRRRRL